MNPRRPTSSALRLRRYALLAATAACVAACDAGPEAPAPAPPQSPAASSASTEEPLAAGPVASLAAGGSRHFASFGHTCAVVDGGLQCWGAGEAGQLGNGLMATRSPRPVRVWPPGSGVTAVAAGGTHSCAVLRGEALCWGHNLDGQIGTARPYIAISPTKVPGLPGPVSLLAAGRSHACAVAGGETWCWGANTHGQVGAPACPEYSYMNCCAAAPVRVSGLPASPDALALGRLHSCAVVDGGVWCWGGNDDGQLGDGSFDDRSEPAPVRDLPGPVTHLAAGHDHTCAIVDGRGTCWGANNAGQLGDGTVENRSRAVVAAPALGGATALTAAGNHTCVVAATGVHCWGDNRGGQLDGVPSAGARPSPVAVAGLRDDVVGLAGGFDHTCAVSAAGGVECWGDNDFGQLGSGDAPADHAGPVPVAAWDDARLRDRNGDGRIAIACLGDSNTMRILRDFEAWCEVLAGLAADRGWRLVNRGEGGATVVEAGSMILADEHLAYALENDAVDAVILAYGTNDIRIARAAPPDIATAYSRLNQRAHAAGIDVFVALTPPARNGEFAAETVELNGLLAKYFPASRVVDFWSGYDDADYIDDIHLGESGHAKRARAAWATLADAAKPVEAP